MNYKSEQKDHLFWVWLSRRLGEGSKRCVLLLERFGTPYDVFQADEEELARLVPELTPRERRLLCEKSLEEAYEIIGYCQRNGIQLLCYNDPRYPLSLRSLVDPPILLYYRGVLPDFQNQLCIAVVGTRKMSEYGRETAYKIAYELAAAGVVVVSGMALGVDSVAACAALAAGGKTVAVFGTGVDIAYPPEHNRLMQHIADRGLVISEFAPGSSPDGWHFPLRNRIISGLCQGTLVIEAHLGSGALITAERAQIQGRDLYAVPGNVGSPSAVGPNNLIRSGANVVLCADDVLKQYSVLYRSTLGKLQTASLGARSDYDPEMIARMNVYSRTEGGGGRIPAKDLGAAAAPTASKKPAAVKYTARPSAEKPRRAPQRASVADQTAQDAPCAADRSAQLLATLGERERRVFDAIPMDRPIAIDRLQSLDYTTGQILSALSILEIKGLIQTLPGGLYSRA